MPGDVLLKQGDLAGSHHAYSDRLAIAKRLAEADPENVRWQRDLARARAHVAKVLAHDGDTLKALDHFRAARAIVVRLKAELPANAALAGLLSALDAEITALRDAEASARPLAHD